MPTAAIGSVSTELDEAARRCANETRGANRVHPRLGYATPEDLARGIWRRSYVVESSVGESSAKEREEPLSTRSLYRALAPAFTIHRSTRRIADGAPRFSWARNGFSKREIATSPVRGWSLGFPDAISRGRVGFSPSTAEAGHCARHLVSCSHSALLGSSNENRDQKSIELSLSGRL